MKIMKIFTHVFFIAFCAGITVFFFLSAFFSSTGNFMSFSSSYLNETGYIIILLTSIPMLASFVFTIFKRSKNASTFFLQSVVIVSSIQLILVNQINQVLEIYNPFDGNNTDLTYHKPIQLIGFYLIPFLLIFIYAATTFFKKYKYELTQYFYPFIYIGFAGFFISQMPKGDYFSLSNNIFYQPLEHGNAISFVFTFIIISTSLAITKFIFCRNFYKPTHLLFFGIGYTLFFKNLEAISNYLMYIALDLEIITKLPMIPLIYFIGVFFLSTLSYLLIAIKITETELSTKKTFLMALSATVIFLVISRIFFFVFRIFSAV